jgi:hypothetical protein
MERFYLHTMIRNPVLLVAVLTVAAWPGIAKATAHREQCVNPGDRVVQRTAAVTVVRAPDRQDTGRPPYYACYRGSTRRWRLDTMPYDHVLLARPAGRWAALVALAFYPEIESGFSAVLLLDVKTGRRFRSFAANEMESVSLLLLRQDGSFVQLRSTGVLDTLSFGTVPQCPPRSCRYIDQRTLDAGSIPRDSVHLQGSTVVWTNNGENHGAELP